MKGFSHLLQGWTLESQISFFQKKKKTKLQSTALANALMGKGSDKKPGLISDAVKTHNWFKKNDQTNIILIFLKN